MHIDCVANGQPLLIGDASRRERTWHSRAQGLAAEERNFESVGRVRNVRDMTFLGVGHVGQGSRDLTHALQKRSVLSRACKPTTRSTTREDRHEFERDFDFEFLCFEGE